MRKNIITRIYRWVFGDPSPVKEIAEPETTPTPEKTSIIFDVDDDLKVTTRTVVRQEVIIKLVDEGYLTSHQIDDEFAINLALILVANDVSEDMITDINKKAKQILE